MLHDANLRKVDRSSLQLYCWVGCTNLCNVCETLTSAARDNATASSPLCSMYGSVCVCSVSPSCRQSGVRPRQTPGGKDAFIQVGIAAVHRTRKTHAKSILSGSQFDVTYTSTKYPPGRGKATAHTTWSSTCRMNVRSS